MIVWLLLLMVRDDCLFVDQTIISHHYHQQTNNHLSPLTATPKQSSLNITINKQSSLTNNINKQTTISHH
jgi:hypothetical protein